jgi:ATP-binding cassette subfamily B protein
VNEADGDSDSGLRGGAAFLRQSLRNHWHAEGTSVIAALICTAAVVAIPELAGRAVDTGLLNHRWGTLTLLGVAIAGLGAVQAVSSGLRRYYNGLASRTVEAELRASFFKRLLGFEIAYHDEVNRGQLLSRVTSDLFQIQALVSSSPMWIANIITILAVAIVLVVINPLLGLVAVAGIPLVIITSIRYSMVVRPALGELQRDRGDLAGVVDEALLGVRAIKGFGAESTLEERLSTQADAVRDRSIGIVRMRCRYNPLLNVMPMFELVGVNWFGGYLVLNHELTVGMLLAFNSYLAVVTGPIQSIGWFVVQVQRALVSARRLETVMTHAPTVCEPARPEPLPRGSGHILFEDVHFAYPGSSGWVLNGFDLEIGGGEVVAIVGPTGSGKSTIAAMLGRLYDPQSGVVRLDGVDVKQLSVGDVRTAVRMVFEDNFLFDDTVADNLRVGRRTASDAEIVDAARIAQAHEFITTLADGYSSSVGERGFSLSGGQRQRVATSAVDAQTERGIVATLGDLPGGMTIILISHRAATIALADRVVLIEAGRVEASGKHDELVSSSALYRRTLGLPGYVEDA